MDEESKRRKKKKNGHQNKKMKNKMQDYLLSLPAIDVAVTVNWLRRRKQKNKF